MNEPPINTSIKNIATQEISKIPTPTTVTITKTYQDGHADAETTYGVIPYIKTIAPCNTGDEAILQPLNGDQNNLILIPNLHNVLNEINTRLTELENPTEEETTEETEEET